MSTATKAEVKFTPGPWKLGDENNSSCDVVLGTKHNVTADLCRQDNNTGEFVIERDEMLANAHLIAAAPEMYEALKAEQFAFELASVDDPQSRTRLLESVGDYESGWEPYWAVVVEKYRGKAALLREAALAKAEGRP